MRIFIFIIGLLILSFFANDAWSGDKHHSRGTKVDVSSQALSISASQLNMDWSTTKLQGSAGTGIHKGVQAISFGLGKRTGKVLINGSVSTDGTDTAIGAGVNWRF